MRRSLYLQDDDFRLSFLYGNFTTLTRFTEADFERVITEKLSPLYVSIHATDPEVRVRLLRNSRGATSLRWLELLLDAGRRGARTGRRVPGHQRRRGARRHAARRARPFPEARDRRCRAARCERAQQRGGDASAHGRRSARGRRHRSTRGRRASPAALGRRLVFASDEYYLLAQREFPPLDAYDDCLQHENGIGMARTFEAEVAAALAGARRRADRHALRLLRRGRRRARRGLPRAAAESTTAERRARCLPTRSAASSDRHRHRRDGCAGARAARCPRSASGPVPRSASSRSRTRFFGGNIGVTGLLTGADVAAAARRPARRRPLPAARRDVVAG